MCLPLLSPAAGALAGAPPGRRSWPGRAAARRRRVRLRPGLLPMGIDRRRPRRSSSRRLLRARRCPGNSPVRPHLVGRANAPCEIPWRAGRERPSAVLDRLLAVESGACAQWRVGGHAGRDRSPIDLGDGEPALDRLPASVRIRSFHRRQSHWVSHRPQCLRHRPRRPGADDDVAVSLERNDEKIDVTVRAGPRRRGPSNQTGSPAGLTRSSRNAAARGGEWIAGSRPAMTMRPTYTCRRARTAHL
jgi:hypothetical protein